MAFGFSPPGTLAEGIATKINTRLAVPARRVQSDSRDVAAAVRGLETG
jgi:hypothetical protein